jgi:hypothetical protein
MPNNIAYIALILWPFVALAIFATNPPDRALIWSLLGGFLLLPMQTEINFPGVPAFDKTSVSNLSAMIGALIFARGPVLRLPREWWLIALMVLYIASPMATALGNRDPLIIGDTALPALRPYDAFSAAAYQAIYLVPFLLGYNLLKGSIAHRIVLRAIAIAASGYSLLMLVEIRLSPQLHNWIYGFFPHSFEQQIRDGAFRPVVFLGHGLMVAIFTAMAILACAYLAKTRSRLFGIPALPLMIYLLVVLILCRSLGALALALLTIPLVFVMKEKTIGLVCAIAAITVLAYPALRGADLIPVQWVADKTSSYSTDRAGSFQTRIDNEDALLAKARQRPLFGWGGYGRNRVFDEFTGRDTSITDGTWIIIVGTYGWVGYLAAFGLLCLPMVATWLRRGKLEQATAALSLVLAVNLLDLLPNSSLTPLTWLIAGTLITVGSRSGKMLRPKTPFPHGYAKGSGGTDDAASYGAKTTRSLPKKSLPKLP